jgi:hypothetical protein
MKTFQSVVALIAFMGLVFLGCSEKSQLPNEPVNALEKVTSIDYTADLTIIGLVDPGSEKIVGQNLIVKDRVVMVRYEASSDLVTGNLLVTINFRFNLNTGEGPTHGKWSKVPDAYPEDLWEGNFTGYRTKTGESEWTDNLHIVGSGEGDVIGGMKNIADALMYSDDIYLRTGFFGTASGVIKSK